MPCLCGSHCLDFPAQLVACQEAGWLCRLQHACQGKYDMEKGVNRDGTELKVCQN